VLIVGLRHAQLNWLISDRAALAVRPVEIAATNAGS